MASNSHFQPAFHFQPTTPAVVPKSLELVSDDLREPLIMNMTMAELYGKKSHSRAAAQVLAAMEEAVIKAGKRNPGLKADDVILAALGMVQKMWDSRMNELRTAACELNQPALEVNKPMNRRPRPEGPRRKNARLTGFLG